MGAATQPAWPWTPPHNGLAVMWDQPHTVPALLPTCFRHQLCPDSPTPQRCDCRLVTNLHQKHPLFCCNESSIRLLPVDPILEV